MAALDHLRSSNFDLANDPSPQLATLMRGTPRQTVQQCQGKSQRPQGQITVREREAKKNKTRVTAHQGNMNWHCHS